MKSLIHLRALKIHTSNFLYFISIEFDDELCCGGHNKIVDGKVIWLFKYSALIVVPQHCGSLKALTQERVGAFSHTEKN